MKSDTTIRVTVLLGLLSLYLSSALGATAMTAIQLESNVFFLINWKAS